jgi:serine/threonine protein kinase
MEWKELYQIVSETSEEHLCVEDFIITNTQLGEGQYGKVFLGYLKSNHTKLIAVKTVCTKKITKKTHSHLLQEIGIMRELNHVNLGNYLTLVKLYDHKQFNNNIYIFLEYCNENNL